MDILDGLMDDRPEEDWVPADRCEAEVSVEFVLSGAVLEDSDVEVNEYSFFRSTSLIVSRVRCSGWNASSRQDGSWS